ncbi:hypothetical protein ACFFX0_06970 [Citricoccus parietis]|uniref:Uncharacterized protein n=1 Tax=Citricoccus parietis TaxID=592307 RepID=A0ABV5FWA1_9MICC
MQRRGPAPSRAEASRPAPPFRHRLQAGTDQIGPTSGRVHVALSARRADGQHEGERQPCRR